MMIPFAIALVAAPLLLLAYAYAGYPALLMLLARVRRRDYPRTDPAEWPSVSIRVPAYNASTRLRPTLDHLLALDYPADRLHILVVSDASSDDTDDVVRTYADRGVELLRLERRSGKTVAENQAVRHMRGELLVNVDATILIPPASLKALVRPFQDPTIGVASGRDVSVGDATREANSGESGYVGYEMWVRELETRCGGIVGASGCFFACRRSVHERQLPGELSWDFASAPLAREQGLRAVSVRDAVCVVPRTSTLSTELGRKVRTMARGLGTLLFLRALMNPFRYGFFACALISHKLVRWLPYLAAPLALVGLVLLALTTTWGIALLGIAAVGIGAGVVAIRWPNGGRLPLPLRLAGFGVAAFTAGALAWLEVARRRQLAVWEPTPRPRAQAS